MLKDNRSIDDILRPYRDELKLFMEDLKHQNEAWFNDLKRHTASLQEDFQHKLSVTIEGLNGRIDGLSEKVEELTARVNDLSIKVDTLTLRMDALTTRVDELTVRVDELTREIKEIKTKLERKVDYKDIYNLNKRLTALEERVNKIK
jgi:chromosome segregation ATPase